MGDPDLIGLGVKHYAVVVSECAQRMTRLLFIALETLGDFTNRRGALILKEARDDCFMQACIVHGGIFPVAEDTWFS